MAKTRPTALSAPLAGLTLLAAGLLAGSCSGNPAKEELRGYEAIVNTLVEEDISVTAQLENFRKDLSIGNEEAEAMGEYGRTQALPFYRRFRERISAVGVLASKLQEVHKILGEFVDHRVAYLEAMNDVLVSSGSEGQMEIVRMEDALREAHARVQRSTGGKLEDPDVLEAIAMRQVFMQRALAPFSRGQVPVGVVEKGLNEDVIPRLKKVADRTAAQRDDLGPAGAIAHWAATELAYFQAVGRNLPEQARIQNLAARSQESWDLSVSARQTYLADLKAYRESLK